MALKLPSLSITALPLCYFSNNTFRSYLLTNKEELAALVALLFVGSAFGKVKDHKNEKKVVTYDGRSLMINGERVLVFSGSIHYPRIPPENWLDIIRKAKAGGLNCIQTYVFWNIHEPVEGQFNFAGNYDLVKYIKMINDEGMFVILRIGPYIEAEWNFGGFPYWLKEVPGIEFRSNNDTFKFHMQRYSKKIVDMMKEEKLFAPQGGPIIMAQIENEYNNVQLAYKDAGPLYIKWAADMAVGLDAGVPWIMCKQKNAPASVINTCNGRHCGDSFTGPNGPNKPSMWTENWTAQYRVFGDPPSQRTAEDIAYSVARFFAKNGTLNNYYMYHGGTNYGRTSSSFVTTRYYDEAPLDEFGLPREPKLGHLRDLHTALKLSKKALLFGTWAYQKVNHEADIHFYEIPGTSTCSAFITHNNTKEYVTVKFRGRDYVIPPKSISILPDCKTVAFNTQRVVSLHNSRNFLVSEKAKHLKWEMYSESVPETSHLKTKFRFPLELYALTKDTSDYAWFSTSIHLNREDLPYREDVKPILQVANRGHAMLAFVNHKYIGSGHGTNVQKKFVFTKPITLKPGTNQITFLGSTVGFPNSGAHMEKRYVGPRGVTIQGLSAGTLDITYNNWGHEVGLKGEKEEVYTENGAKTKSWIPAQNGPPLTWYKTYFETPEGNDPIALRMNGMAKGMIWVNGRSIGRYWVSYLSPLGKPTQSEYHVPRAFVKPGKNLLVVLEEEPGVKPQEIEVVLVNRDTVCSFITESHPPPVHSWEVKGGKFKSVGKDPKPTSLLSCPIGQVIEKVNFASFGNPEGVCGTFKMGSCHSSNTQSVVEKACLRKTSCEVPLDKGVFGDKCPEIPKILAIEVTCGASPTEKVGQMEIPE